MNQIKLFIQQKNIVINNLSLNFNDIKDIKEKTKLINFKNIQEGIYLFQENIYYLEEEGKIFIDEISDINDMNKKIYKNLISVTRKKNKLELRFFLEHLNKNENKCLIEVAPTLEDAYFYLMNYNGDN